MLKYRYNEVIFIHRIKYFTPWILTISWMVIIFMFSAQQAEQSQETSSGFSEILANLLYNDFEMLTTDKQTEILSNCQFIVRKCAHFSIYGMLGILTLISCKLSHIKKYPLISAVICLIYAVSDEIHQHFVEGRSCEVRDMIIDFSGSVTGILGIMIVFYFLNKKRKEVIK